MTYHDLIDTFGSGAEAGRELGYSRQAVSRWTTSGIPERAQIEIHQRTRGRVKADSKILTKYREMLRAA